MKENISLYIHIPFCEKKCYYCDFVSYTNQTKECISDYIEKLIMEIDLYKDKLKRYNVKTIFIGGGTPSIIDSRYISQILNHIRDNFCIDKEVEITIEANPGSINNLKVKEYKEAGINRFSLGLQSTNNKILKQIGRIHSYEDFLKSYNILKDEGIENINIDLIFALPNQSFEDIEVDLDNILSLDLKHVSYYSLILEGNTPMQKWYEEGRFEFPEDDIDRKMYHYIVDRLKENGYIHYEISNFSKKNKKCNHNIAYWKIMPYIGFGVSSHSYLDGKRFSNTKNLQEYIKMINLGKLPIVEVNETTLKDEIEEYCIFGSRLIDGINKLEFKNRFNKDIYFYYEDVINKHINDGLLIDDEKNIKLTKRGLDLANLVEMDFLL